MKPKRPSARPHTKSSPGLTRALSSLPPPITTMVALTSSGLRVGDREIPFLAGAVHYFRLEREAWEPALREIQHLGLPIVETYVPWQTHEIGPGNFDFGRVDPRKDLRAFIELAKSLGLFVFLRPGPHINAEMTYFGLPERIVYDKACQARSPSQGPVIQGFPPRMFPVPSYASETFRDEVERWFEAVAEETRDYVYPKGPVILLQVDNEGAYYFRDNTYEQDYHPDAVERLRDWLLEKYGTVEETSSAHRMTYESREAIQPPTRFDLHRDTDDEPATWSKLTRHLDWSAFREDMITDAVRDMKGMLDRVGLTGLPTVHNLPLGEISAPMSLPDLEDVLDVVGLDYYHARRENRVIKRRTLYLAGSSRLPIAPEMGIGAPPWFTPLAHEDSLYTAMVAYAYGLRGMNLYMAVDRDRWYGAPIDARGNPRVESGAWKRFINALESVQFHKLKRRAPVGLVLPREYVRLSRATHLLGVLSPVALGAIGLSPVEASSNDSLGFEGPIQLLWWKFVARFAEALTHQGVPYVLVDGDVHEARWRRHRVLIVPSFEFASQSRWKALTQFASDGGRIIFGPAMPTMDELMQPRLFEVPRDAKKVLIDTDEDAVRIVQELLATEPELSLGVHASHPDIEVTLHEDDANPRVLFVMNPTKDHILTSIATTGRFAETRWSLEDMMTGERFFAVRQNSQLTFEGGFSIEMPGASVRMLRITLGTSFGSNEGEAERIAG